MISKQFFFFLLLWSNPRNTVNNSSEIWVKTYSAALQYVRKTSHINLVDKIDGLFASWTLLFRIISFCIFLGLFFGHICVFFSYYFMFYFSGFKSLLKHKPSFTHLSPTEYFLILAWVIINIYCLCIFLSISLIILVTVFNI